MSHLYIILLGVGFDIANWFRLQSISKEESGHFGLPFPSRVRNSPQSSQQLGHVSGKELPAKSY